MQAAFTNQNNFDQPILIILEEFDLFAMHPKQTLLYNLFDLVSSSKKTPMAIIGLSCRWDAIELLEKRVRSRFSNRQLSLSLPENFSQFSYVISKTLQLRDDFPDRSYSQEYQNHLEV
jgi:origin recognition complex subunit 4